MDELKTASVDTLITSILRLTHRLHDLRPPHLVDEVRREALAADLRAQRQLAIDELKARATQPAAPVENPYIADAESQVVEVEFRVLTETSVIGFNHDGPGAWELAEELTGRVERRNRVTIRTAWKDA